MVQELQLADRRKTKLPMRTRNYDVILELLRGNVFTWSEITAGVSFTEFENMFLRLIACCDEHRHDPIFTTWLLSDLTGRFKDIRNKSSNAGSAMAIIIQMPDAA